jgi:hypothetical protein
MPLDGADGHAKQMSYGRASKFPQQARENIGRGFESRQCFAASRLKSVRQRGPASTRLAETRRKSNELTGFAMSRAFVNSSGVIANHGTNRARADCSGIFLPASGRRHPELGATTKQNLAPAYSRGLLF